IELRLIDRLDLLELGHELAPEALHIAPDANRVAPLEAGPEPIDVAEGACRDRAAAITELHREVNRAVAGREAVLAHAGVDPTESLPRLELGARGGGGAGFH